MSDPTTIDSPQEAVASDHLFAIGERLRTQDNRCTRDPMFCVQILVVEPRPEGMGVGKCWWNPGEMECVYDEPPEDWDEYGETNGWERYGYDERWETVMVAFTERGCEEYLELDGHNVRRRAHQGKVRIYAESWQRCPEMLTIRKALMANDTVDSTRPADSGPNSK